MDQLNRWVTLVANLGVLIGVFVVAYEIRQNTVQAQAAAYQELGVAVQGWFLALDDRDNRLFTEANYPEALKRWELSDWETYTTLQTAALRWVETFMLQVDEGLLDADAMTKWGFSFEDHPALETVGFICIWPELSNFVGAKLRVEIDKGLGDFGPECPVDLPALRDQTILEGDGRS